MNAPPIRKSKRERGMMRGLVCALYPNHEQRVVMRRFIAGCMDVFNWCLTMVKAHYAAYLRGEVEKSTLSNFDLKTLLVKLRKDRPSLGQIPSDILRSAIDRFTKAMEGFFRRVAAGEKPGFPRFKKIDRYKSFSFPMRSIVGEGRSARVFIPGLKGVKFFLYQKLRGTCTQVTVLVRSTGEWRVSFALELEAAPAKAPLDQVSADEVVGLDLGLTSFVATHDGTTFENPRHYKASEKKLAKAQRFVHQTEKGSNGNRKAKVRVAKLHEHIANQRKNTCRMIAAWLVRQYKVICLEKLNIIGLARGMLSKSVAHAGWGYLVQCVRSKAEEAGCWVVEVDPRDTTRTCSGCGHVQKKALSERVHDCHICGLVLDRDVNAARVVLARGLAALGTSVAKVPVVAGQVHPEAQRDAAVADATAQL